MSEPIIVPAAKLNQAVYIAVAIAREDLETDILAGVTCHMLLEHGGLSTQEIRAAIDELQQAITAQRPDPRFDLSPNASIAISRILSRVVPALTTPVLRDGARRYTRAFLSSHRRDTGQLRQVAPIELQFDRLGEVARFRRHTWQQLYELARDDPAIAEAIDQSAIGEALGVETTQDATTLLDLVTLQPLASFVADHLQADGGLMTTPAEIEAVLDGVSVSMQGLRNEYAENLIGINRVEQQTRDEAARRSAGFVSRSLQIGAALLSPTLDQGVDGGDEPGPRATDEEEKSALEKAIDKAEAKQKELDSLLKNIGSGAKGTLDVLAIATEGFDDEFATDIREFASITTTMLDGISKFAKAAIETAKVVEGLSSASASKLLLGGAIGFNFAMIAVAIQVFGLLGKPRTKPVNQIILEQLGKISEQITDLRDEMRVRFDRIEKQLDKMYAGILNRFAEIDFELGQIEGNVEEVQLSLYGLHSELQRLNRNIHTFLEAAHRRDLVEAVNGFLNFLERTGQDLAFADFLRAENEFFSWGFSHAKDALQAGPEDRSFQDDDLFTELNALPLATNVNYLRQWPAERFGLPSLALNRLANPFDWIIASEAYAQLNEESPGHAVEISPARVESLSGVGEVLGEALAEIADDDLFAALAEHYRFAFAQLKNAIRSFEGEFRIDPNTGLRGIDPWGGADQEPNRHFFLEDFDEIRRCDGRPFDAAHVSVPTNVFPFDHSQLRPYMVASNLRDSRIPGVGEGLHKLSACVLAHWRTISIEELGLGQLVRIEYRLTITVEIRYGESTVFAHRFNTDERHTATVRKDKVPTFDPVTDPVQGKDPYRLLVGDKRLWDQLRSFPATHGLVSPALRSATIAAVEHKLTLVQRAFYAEVARRFERAGDPIQEGGQRLTGSKLLWQSYVITGFPLSIEANEILRSLLFGSDALLAGADTESQDTLLDDVQDIYAYFSSRDEDPLPSNILGDIEAIANDRLDRLTSILSEIVATIETSGQPEPPALFAPTLLRLSLIHA